ncbi:hypothetical protein [Aggregicoccus sp. 17bor-14]|uniref:hypothetical protein n=1 Tax=Myxococcaceae TaxID=31 RepID=UPI00351A8954
MALLLALYVLAFPYHPGLRSPNELARLWQARAWVDHGTLEMNGALQDYGRVGDLSVKDGRYYSSKAPLLSLAAVPVYAALEALAGGDGHRVSELWLVYLSRLLLTVAPTLPLLLLLHRFLAAQGLPWPLPLLLTATYALGTLAFSYSLLFMSHQASAVLLFAGFYALWQVGRGAWRERGYLAAGACAGAALAAEYTGALAVLALVLYAALQVLLRPELPLRERLVRLARGGGLALVGALPFVLGLMAYHQAAFGHPLESGYKHLADAAYQPWHLGGFLGIRLPDPRALELSLFSPLRGLFALSPVLLLALPGLWLLGRRKDSEGRALFWLTGVLCLGYAYFTASFSYASWGWTTGPRHLTGLVPFLMLPVGLALAGLQRRGGPWAGVGAGLCAASVLVTGLLTLVNYVPDDVSDGLFALALPLFRAGSLPPTVLSLFGVASALPGALLVLGVVAMAAWALLRLSRTPAAVAAGLAVVAAVLVLHAASARHDAADAGAVRFLQSVWLVRAD